MNTVSEEEKIKKRNDKMKNKSDEKKLKEQKIT